MTPRKYSRELDRLSSFKDFDGSSSILFLARLGFYFNSVNGIHCHQCDFSAPVPDVGTDLIDKHRQISPYCTTATDRDQRNIPMKPLTGDFEKRTKSELWLRSPKKGGKSNRDQTDNMIDSSASNGGPVETSPFLLVCRSIIQRALNKGIVDAEFDPSRPDFELLKKEIVRLNTFSQWPSSAPVTKDDLARNGFYYTGISDRVQCVFCRGYLKNWTVGDDVVNEHKRHFADCPFVKGQNVGNVAKADEVNDGSYNVMAVERRRPIEHGQETAPNQPVTTDSSSGQSQYMSFQLSASSHDAQLMMSGPDDGANVADSLPAYSLKHPQFADRQTRKRTFMLARGRLPRGQNVDTLVDAGFFHVGPLDNVKCFCCDIGLKNWQNDDNPWTEHARWSPRCAYVKEKRGEAFIQQTLAINQQRIMHRANHNNMQLPSLNVEPANFSLLGSLTMPPPTTSATPEPYAADGLRRLDVEQLPGAPGMLVDEDVVGTDVGVYLDEEQAAEARRQRQLNNSGIDVDNDPEAQHLLAENQQLRQVKTCKVCMDREVNIVFLPCGHLVCCEDCAPNLRTCAICRTYIRGTVKVFLS